MALRSSGRKLSFDILTSGSSLEEDDFLAHRSHMTRDQIDNPIRKKKKKKKKQHLDRTQESQSTTIPEDPITESGTVDDATGPVINGHAFVTAGNNGSVLVSASVVSSEVATVTEAGGGGCRGVFNNSCGELRQRNVNNNGGGGGGGGEEEVAELVSSSWGDESGGLEVSSEAEKMPRRSEEQPSSGCLPMTKLETAQSLDWKKLMAEEDPNYLFSLENSPVKYFIDEICKGNSLKSTTNLGSEKEREKVYDTIFRLPWRCEVLIDVGFFVCLDSFLSLLTIMPTRLVMTLWRFLNTRQFKKLSAAELSDIGCFFVLASGVALLEQTDISLIYHMIRGQGTIKLYVVYNVLEIFDKLCQSFVGDVLQTLFSSAEGLASCSPENMGFWIWRFIYDQALSMAVSILHSFILLAQAITLSTCIVAHNNALLALLVSNNFAEIKSNVFKRFSKENIHNLVYSDSVERFHISAFLLFVLAQNILEAEGPWFESFLFNALLVFLCEMLIDIIKHSFLAKFNDIKPIAYSEFLEDLCNQTLNIRTEEKKKNLTFVPLAPACVVIRVLTPVYAAHLPYTPIPWRLFWILLLSAMTYVMLTSLKVMIGMGLQKHATWYVNRCRKRKHHLHAD